MRNAASFILTRSSVLWSVLTDKHKDIIVENKLNYKTNSPDFVRIKISPEDGNYKSPIKNWIYKVDQDFLPEWYNAEWAEKACRDELKKWAKVHIVKNKTIKILKGELSRILINCNIEILKLTDGDVRFYGLSTCTANNSTGGHVEFYGLSTCTANNSTGGHVEFCGSSTCTANNSTGGYVEFYESSTCTANNSTGGNVEFYGSSTCTANNSTGGNVEFYESSTCTANNSTGGYVRFYGSSTCTANNSTGGDVEFFGLSTCTANNSTGGDVWFFG